MKKNLKIKFADFHKGFNPGNNYFWGLLSERYNLELSDQPDIMLYSSFGRTHINHRGLKIYWTGENRRPDFRDCDFAFTFDRTSPDGKNYRMPLYVHCTHTYGYGDLRCMTGRNSDQVRFEKGSRQKTKFCNMVLSNSRRDRIAMDFFYKLSEYKKVDSGGRYLNNIGAPVPDKLAFIKDYKFTMAFENRSYPGYTTEKILDSMLAGSIPIYWGSPDISDEFNPESFVNVHDFATLDDAVQRVIEIDQDEELYGRMISAPFFHDDRVPEYLTTEAILERFAAIIDNRKEFVPVSCTWRYYPRYLVIKLKDICWLLLRMIHLRTA